MGETWWRKSKMVNEEIIIKVNHFSINQLLITAPLPNAAGQQSICKSSPFGKDVYFALQMSKKQLALSVIFR